MMVFKVGDRVKINPTSKYASQIENCRNTGGTILARAFIPSLHADYNEVGFDNGYENAYSDNDLLYEKNIIDWKRRLEAKK